MKRVVLFLVMAIAVALAPLCAMADEPEPQPVYAGVAVTDEEMVLLQQIIWAEANNQRFEGQKAVCEVIFNRLQSPAWPDTIEGVLSQRGQFATWKGRHRAHPTETQADVIREVLAETETVIPQDYVFFATGRYRWMHDCFKLQDHWFGR